MIKSRKNTCKRKAAFLLPLFFLSLAMNAQKDTDTTRYLSDEIQKLRDSVLQESPDEEPVDEYYQDTIPSYTSSVYFTERRFQPNGGGPDSVQYRKLPDSTIKKMKADDQFWYVDYAFDKKEKKKPENKESSVPLVERDWFQTLLWMIIIGSFVAVIILYLSSSNIGLFRKASRVAAGSEEAYVETDNIFEINYQTEIDKAVANKNYRLAVRLLFLRVLKNLADKNIIHYKQDRTNFDYLLQLNSTKYYNDFFRLTRFYEYSWYGQFEIEPEKFPGIKNDFENFDRNLKQ